MTGMAPSPSIFNNVGSCSRHMSIDARKRDMSTLLSNKDSRESAVVLLMSLYSLSNLQINSEAL